MPEAVLLVVLVLLPVLQPKFLLDSMLGRLCRWLRAMGIDAEFVEPGQQGQSQQQSTLIQQVQEAALLQVSSCITFTDMGAVGPSTTALGNSLLHACPVGPP